MFRVAIVSAGDAGQESVNFLEQASIEFAYVGLEELACPALGAKDIPVVPLSEFDPFEFDLVFIAVPTLQDNEAFDGSYLALATLELGMKLSQVRESFPVLAYQGAIKPGTLRELIVPLLSDTVSLGGRVVGKNFGAIYISGLATQHTQSMAVASLRPSDRALKIMGRFLRESFQIRTHWVPFEDAEVLSCVRRPGFNLFG